MHVYLFHRCPEQGTNSVHQRSCPFDLQVLSCSPGALPEQMPAEFRSLLRNKHQRDVREVQAAVPDCPSDSLSDQSILMHLFDGLLPIITLDCIRSISNVAAGLYFSNAKPRPCPEFTVRPTLAAASAEIVSAAPPWLFKKRRMTARRRRVLQRCL